jgi:hypothetical protein
MLDDALGEVEGDHNGIKLDVRRPQCLYPSIESLVQLHHLVLLPINKKNTILHLLNVFTHFFHPPCLLHYFFQACSPFIFSLFFLLVPSM